MLPTEMEATAIPNGQFVGTLCKAPATAVKRADVDEFFTLVKPSDPFVALLVDHYRTSNEQTALAVVECVFTPRFFIQALLGQLDFTPYKEKYAATCKELQTETADARKRFLEEQSMTWLSLARMDEIFALETLSQPLADAPIADAFALLNQVVAMADAIPESKERKTNVLLACQHMMQRIVAHIDDAIQTRGGAGLLVCTGVALCSDVYVYAQLAGRNAAPDWTRFEAVLGTKRQKIRNLIQQLGQQTSDVAPHFRTALGMLCYDATAIGSRERAIQLLKDTYGTPPKFSIAQPDDIDVEKVAKALIEDPQFWQYRTDFTDGTALLGWAHRYGPNVLVAGFHCVNGALVSAILKEFADKLMSLHDVVLSVGSNATVPRKREHGGRKDPPQIQQQADGGRQDPGAVAETEERKVQGLARTVLHEADMAEASAAQAAAAEEAQLNAESDHSARLKDGALQQSRQEAVQWMETQTQAVRAMVEEHDAATLQLASAGDPGARDQAEERARQITQKLTAIRALAQDSLAALEKDFKRLDEQCRARAGQLDPSASDGNLRAFRALRDRVKQLLAESEKNENGTTTLDGLRTQTMELSGRLQHLPNFHSNAIRSAAQDRDFQAMMRHATERHKAQTAARLRVIEVCDDALARVRDAETARHKRLEAAKTAIAEIALKQEEKKALMLDIVSLETLLGIGNDDIQGAAAKQAEARSRLAELKGEVGALVLTITGLFSGIDDPDGRAAAGNLISQTNAATATELDEARARVAAVIELAGGVRAAIADLQQEVESAQAMLQAGPATPVFTTGHRAQLLDRHHRLLDLVAVFRERTEALCQRCPRAAAYTCGSLAPSVVALAENALESCRHTDAAIETTTRAHTPASVLLKSVASVDRDMYTMGRWGPKTETGAHWRENDPFTQTDTRGSIQSRGVSHVNGFGIHESRSEHKQGRSDRERGAEQGQANDALSTASMSSGKRADLKQTLILPTLNGRPALVELNAWRSVFPVPKRPRVTPTEEERKAKAGRGRFVRASLHSPVQTGLTKRAGASNGSFF